MRSKPRPLRIFLIAYRFPPQVGGGVHRPLRNVKYWRRHGHEVCVLTTTVDPRSTQDPTLLRWVPDDTPIERVFDPSVPLLIERLRSAVSEGQSGRLVSRGLGYAQGLAQSLSVPDRQAGWLGPSLLRAHRICQRFRPDVIVPSGPPWTPFIMARLLARMTGIPLVLDYRDAWTGVFVQGAQTFLGRHLDPSLESWVLRGASGVVAAHRSIFRDLPKGIQSRGRPLPRLWSPNGYDAEDIPLPDGAAQGGDRFLLSYTGALGGHRNPRTFFRTLDSLLQAGSIDAQRIRVRIAGGFSSPLRQYVSTLPRASKVVEYLGYLSHAQSVALLRESHVNLIFIRDIDDRNRHSPGKVYEVFYVGRPVMLLSPDGVTPRLARRLGGCAHSHPTDAGTVERHLLDLYQSWERGEDLGGPDRSGLAFYDREHQARRFARFLQTVCTDG